jgi:O-antigen/teichoic acid export membrane protein
MLKRLFTDTAIYGFGDFVFKVIGFAVFPIYARIFTVEEFGIMTLLGTVAGIAAIFSELGLNNAVQRYYWDPQTSEGDRPVLVSTGLWILIFASVAITVVLLGGSYPFREALRERYQADWFLLALIVLSNTPGQILQYAQNVLRLKFAPWKFTILAAARNCLAAALTLVLILRFHQGLSGYFYGSLFGLMGAMPLAVWFLRDELRFKIDRPMSREILKFGYPFIFVGLGYWVFSSVDRVMLAGLSNNGIAQKFAFVLVFLNSAIGQAWAPAALKLYADDRNYRQVYSRVFSYLFFGLVSAGAAVCLFSRDVLHWMTPPAYWPAADTLCVLTMAQVIAGTTQITAIGISLEKKTHLFTLAAWLTGGLSLLLNWLLIPRWGALGAAFASLGCNAALSALYLYWTQVLHPLPLQTAQLLAALSAVVLVLWVAFYLNAMTITAQLSVLPWKIGGCGILLLCAGITLRTRFRLGK